MRESWRGTLGQYWFRQCWREESIRSLPDKSKFESESDPNATALTSSLFAQQTIIHQFLELK